MRASDQLRAEVLERLRALAVAHPERTVHLAIDVAQHGPPRPVPEVHAALEELRERREVMPVGGGWRLADGPDGVWLEVRGVDQTG